MIYEHMLKSLRNRLILSHILPLLITLPLMGIGLIYVLETQIYLPSLSNELENDANFVAHLTLLNETIWHDPTQAQTFLNLYSARNNARIMLIDRYSGLLASSEPADLSQPDQFIDGADLSALQRLAENYSAPSNGEAINGTNNYTIRQTHYSPHLDAEIVDVFVPVQGHDGSFLGFVRMSYPFASITGELFQLRFLIVILLTVGLLLGSGLGYLLAVSVSKPVQEVTRAISELAHNSQMKLLTVYGSEEIQSLTQSVNDLVTRLRELEQARRMLLANLVHELGRPLGALRSATTALAHGAEKDPQLYRDLVNGMDGETARLQYLLNDLSGLYDQVLGSINLDRQSIDLRAWLPEILGTWQTAALEKGLQWQLTCPDNPMIISGDPMRLAQVVGNLVSNAIKFSAPGGTVSVSTTRNDSEVGIRVQDTGPGMNLEEQERIFQPFYRGSHGRRFPQGMGLGLSIARDLTEAHGGHLSVESTPGQGSCFTVWLPADNTGDIVLRSS